MTRSAVFDSDGAYIGWINEHGYAFVVIERAKYPVGGKMELFNEDKNRLGYVVREADENDVTHRVKAFTSKRQNEVDDARSEMLLRFVLWAAWLSLFVTVCVWVLP